MMDKFYPTEPWIKFFKSKGLTITDLSDDETYSCARADYDLFLESKIESLKAELKSKDRFIEELKKWNIKTVPEFEKARENSLTDKDGDDS